MNYPLPCTEAERDQELDELFDLILENVPLEDMRKFRKCGVKVGHA